MNAVGIRVGAPYRGVQTVSGKRGICFWVILRHHRKQQHKNKLETQQYYSQFTSLPAHDETRKIQDEVCYNVPLQMFINDVLKKLMLYGTI